MSNILVPIDFSDYSLNALEFALGIARKVNAHVTLYHCFHISVPNDYFVMAASYANGEVEAQQQSYERQLDALIDKYSTLTYENTNEPVHFERLVKLGMVADDIEELTASGNYNLVVMGTQGVSGIAKVILGSVTAAAAVRSACPLIAVPKNSVYNGIAHIVYATAFHRKDIAVLDELLEFAGFFNAKITCLHVTTDPDYAATDQHKMKNLNETFWFTPLDKLSFELVNHYSVEKGIDNYLSEHQTDLLAVLSQERSFWERLFNRSVSQNFAFHSTVPVLIMKHRKSG